MTIPSEPKTVEIAVPLPVETAFTYTVPPELREGAVPGARALVPFGRRTLTGYILSAGGAEPDGAKAILHILDPEPLLTPAELDFLRWAASYYHHPLGEVIKAALPAGINISSGRKGAGEDGESPGLRGGKRPKSELFYRLIPSAAAVKAGGRADRVLTLLQEAELPASRLRQEAGADATLLRKLLEKGLVAAVEREVYRDPFREELPPADTPPPLNPAQTEALDRVVEAIGSGTFSSFLLHGVTGSGKTEVYLRAIGAVLDRGKTALVLVPEIALTPQLVRRFRQRFRGSIAVLHSGLSEGERYDEWRRIRKGEVRIVIGVRSAIFAPLDNIGIIVVDEEQESSYKQSERFRYNARDLALVRGKMANACVLLGSATPLVTTWHAARSGRIGYLRLPCRVRNLPMPEVELLDSRGKREMVLLPELREAVRRNLESGGQTLLFLNRRGFATWLTCSDCGHVLRCPNCSITLTYHQGRNRHSCHYCDFSIPAPSVCPECCSAEITLLGCGTERVEEEVKTLFPEARVGRMDRDTTTGIDGHARVLRGLETGSLDILVGTQMIAKGHDFPGVTLVGVLNADTTLNLPDFRSAEKTYQLISQVMGRAGRGDEPGRVLIQTLNPEHYAIARAAAHDEGFYHEELEFRKETGYPPFGHLATLVLSAVSAETLRQEAEHVVAALRRARRSLGCRVEILGPVVAPLARIRGRHRRHILLKSASRTELHRLVSACRSSVSVPATVRMAIDVDPVEML